MLIKLRFIICFSYNHHIRDYYIFSRHKQSCVLYAIHDKEGYRYWLDSLGGLIDHYHHHPIYGGDLLLTAPVV